MNIVNVIQCANLGGMEQASFQLMLGLQARGHLLSLVSLNEMGLLGEQLKGANIPAQGLNYGVDGKLRTAVRLRRALQTQRPDALILTGHSLVASAVLGGICRGRRLMAMHYHHSGVMSDRCWRTIYRVAVRTFGNITYPSDFVRHEAEAIYPPVRAIASTLRNPVLIPPANGSGAGKAFREKHGIPTLAPLVGNAGWLIRRKRFDVFLRTAACVLNQRPDAYFVVAGDGEDRELLLRLSASLGLADRVRWVGWMKDLSSFYSAIDVMLFNSDWDAMGMTPLEAAAHQIPVVASVTNGGLAELLDHSCAWIYREHNLTLLSNAVLTALGSEGPERAKRAKMRLEKQASPGVIAEVVERKLSGEPEWRE